MIKNTPTICSFCSNGCGMFIRTDGVEPQGILPVTGHPVSEGRLCHRGWNRFQNLRSLNRVIRPLIREGGQLKEVDWEKALRKCNERLSELINSYGPQSLGVVGSPWLTNEDNYFISLFCQQVLKSNNLDGSYRFSGASALTGLAQFFSGSLGSLGSISSMRESPAILVLGRGSLRDFSPVGSRIIQSFLKGGKVILADPSSQRAEHFYKFRLPYALESLSFALKERAEVPDEVFQCLSQAGSALVFIADEVNQSSSLVSLLAFFSQLLPTQNRIPTVIPISRSPNLRGAWDMGIKPGEEGLNLQEMLDAESKIKGLLIFADDLLTHLPSSSMVERLKSLEFLMVADRFFTETTRIAHCILPIPLLAEGGGTMTNTEGRIQKLRPALNPREESRSLLEILPELSERLGNPLRAFSESEVRREISTSVPGYQQIASESELDSVSGILLPPPKQNGVPLQPSRTTKSPKEEEYFLLIPNTLYAWNRNQMILESPVLKIECPSDRLVIRMSSQDAREYRIRMGEKVRIRSERGEVQVPVELDENLPSRTLVLPSHFITLMESLAGKGELDLATRSLYYPNLYVTLEKI
ncbi:MAG: molybdopterin-dependent oxidoreductase [Syntrophales bacterium]|nr:molybdopterin-dependent oxidoreductase [Syntrophales bacterium]